MSNPNDEPIDWVCGVPIYEHEGTDWNEALSLAFDSAEEDDNENG